MISFRRLKSRIVKKRSDRELIVDRFFARRVSIYITWLLAHLPVTANQVTLASLLIMLAGTVCFGLSLRWAPAVGAGLLLLGYVLDCCDGEIARFREQTSLRGVYLDTLAHAITIPAMFLGAGIGQFLRHCTVESLAYGAIAAVAASSPAKAALAAMARKGTANAHEPDAAPQPFVTCPVKAAYLKTIARLLIFPNSMFVLCVAALAESTLYPSAIIGPMYAALAGYAVLLSLEQIAAAAAWSREERLKQEVQ